MKLTTSSAVIATLATSTVVEAGRFSSRSRQQQRQLSTYGYGEGLALEDIAGYTPGTTVSVCLVDLVLYLFVLLFVCLSMVSLTKSYYSSLSFIIIHHSSLIMHHRLPITVPSISINMSSRNNSPPTPTRASRPHARSTRRVVTPNPTPKLLSPRPPLPTLPRAMSLLVLTMPGPRLPERPMPITQRARPPFGYCTMYPMSRPTMSSARWEDCRNRLWMDVWRPREV